MPSLRKILGMGEWKGHPQGPFAITRDLLKSAYEYFNNRSVKIPVNYEHNPRESAGWITRMELKDDGLYGEVEYNDKATADIKDDQYPYVSPELLFGVPDEVTGQPVPLQTVGLAITKMPFMHDLGETVLNRKATVLCSYDIHGNEVIHNSITQGANMDPKEIMSKMLAAAGMPPETPPEQLESFVKKLREFLAMMPSDSGQPPTPDEAGAMLPEMVENHKLVGELTKQLNCKKSEISEKVTAMAETKADPKAGEEVVKLSKQVDEQKKQIEELEVSARTARLEVFLSKNERKIPPAILEETKAQFIANEKYITAFYDAQPDVIADSKLTPVQKAPESLTPQQVQLAKTLGVSPEAYLAEIKAKQERRVA